MSRIRNLILVAGCIAFFANGAEVEIALSGTVKDGAGTAIDSAVVTLASDPSMKDTTNAAGEFILGNVTAIRNGNAYGVSIQNTGNIGIKGNQIRFSIASPAHKGVISIFAGNGKRSALLPLGAMETGVQQCALPDIAPGLYVMTITINNATTTCKLVNTGSDMYLSSVSTGTAGSSRISRNAEGEINDTIVVKKSGYTTAKKAITSHNQSGIAIVMEVEGPVVCELPELPASSGLTTVNEKLPDPFKFFDGTMMTKKSQWPCRRKEILAMAQKYIYGQTPPVDSPEVKITGTVSGGTVNASIEYNGTTKSASFNIGSSGKILYISYGSGIAPSGCRTWSIDNATMDNYNNTINGIYGYKAGCRVMAAVWAVNVVCAVIDQNPDCGIDYVMTSGCSASGKSAFVTGCFCEGVDLTVVVESGGIGGASYRMAEWFKNGAGKSRWKCADRPPQNLDNTDNGDFSGAPYFSTSVASWVASPSNIKNITKLPYDQHCLLACIAPRACCYLTNSNGINEYCHLGGTCEALSAWAAEPVWNALGVPENFGFRLPDNVYGHCFEIPAAHTALANTFFKRVFEGDKTAKTDVMNLPAQNLQQDPAEWKDMWVDWNMETILE